MHEDDISKEQLIADLGFLNETAMGFLRRSPETDLYEHIVERLACITGDSWVAISSFHPEREASRLRALTGPGDLRVRALRMLGESPIGRYRKISEDAKLHLLTGRLHKVPGGLYDVLFERVPRSVAKMIERFASISEIYSMGCAAQGELLAAVLILLREAQPMPRAEVVEAFVNQAAVALQRDQAEERLRQKDMECRVLIDQVVDLFVVLDRDLTILDINRRGCAELGYTRTDLVGQNFIRVLDPADVGNTPVDWNLVRSGRRFTALRPLRRSDGTCRRYQARVSPLPDGRLLIIASDVSEMELAVSKPA